MILKEKILLDSNIKSSDFVSKKLEVIPGRCQTARQDIRPIIFVVITAIVSYYKVVQGIWIYPLIITGVVLLTYFSIVPRAMRPVSNGLIFIANHIGKINNWLLLSFVFYIVLTPVGFVSRKVSSSHYFKLGFSKTSKSYFESDVSKEKYTDFRKMY